MAYYAKRKLPATMWAGFSDGLMYLDAFPDPQHPFEFQGALYFTRRQARRFYQDVRRVEIREVKTKRRRNPRRNPTPNTAKGK
jgi:hypothetical protein